MATARVGARGGQACHDQKNGLTGGRDSGAGNQPALRWPIMAVEMEPEGVLLHLLGDCPNCEGQTNARSSLWHVADAERALTWCGLDVGYGNLRRRWSETPADQRCQMCLDRLGGTPAL